MASSNRASHGTASSAMHKAMSNAVILRSIGEESRYDDLFNLCLVNRVFHSELLVMLYRDIRVSETNQLLALVGARNLHLTRSLRVTGRALQPDLPPTSSIGEPSVKESFSQVLQAMPNLQSFSCIALPLPAAPLLRLLRDAPNSIQSLRVEFDEDWPPFVVAPDSAAQHQQVHLGWEYMNHYNRSFLSPKFAFDLVGFKNLQSLAITEICLCLPAWTEMLCQVLRDSPDLEHLELSISEMGFTFEKEQREETGEIPRGGWPDLKFFDNICEKYYTAGGAPLRLRSLKCVTFLHPTNEDLLQRLVDLRFLEEVHIDNRRFGNRQEDDTWRCYMVPLAIFVYKCPRLRLLSLYEMEVEVYEALRSIVDHEFSRGLAVFARQPGMSAYHREYDGGLLWVKEALETSAYIPHSLGNAHLPLPLRMLDYCWTFEHPSRDSAVSTSGQSPNFATTRAELLPDNRSLDLALGTVEEHSADTLVGLGISLVPQGRATIREQATEMIPGISRLLGSVAKFSRLTQLLVFIKSDEKAVYENVAKALAADSPSLQFICVNHEYARRVVRSHLGTTGEPLVRLEAMDGREIEGVELWQHCLLHKLFESIG